MEIKSQLQSEKVCQTIHNSKDTSKMNGNTKLSEALKYGNTILEYIISLNPHDFERLRNPLMRQVMPARISLKRIATMVKMPEQQLIDKVNELAGLPLETVDNCQSQPSISHHEKPDWMNNMDESKIQWVNVLEGDAKLEDPMPPINIATNQLEPGQILGIKHKWEAQPLYDIWDSRQLLYWSEQIGLDEWHIFVYKPMFNNPPEPG
jgi:hypothetical protein